MDLLFLLAVLFIIGCFIWRKKLGIFFHDKKKKPQELPMKQEVLERPEIVAYKMMVYNARDYGSTKDMENAMELRLEQCLAGLSKQGVRYEVAFYAAGYVLVCIVKHWY